MQNNLHQKVLPFLADDPLYVCQVREERIVSEVREALEPVLQKKITQIIFDMAEAGFSEKLDALVAHALKHAVADIHGMFFDIRLLLQDLLLRIADSHDPADWWKRVEPDEDQDIPF